MKNKEFGFVQITPKIKQLTIQIILPWLLIYIALFFRAYKADYYPIHNESDSIKYVWAGNSLIRDFFKPVSNSIFIAELEDSLIWRSDYNFLDTIRRFRFHLVEPFLDTPPLGMVYFAIPAYLFKVVDFTQIPPILYMLPAVILSAVSLIMTFLLTKNLLGIRVAYLALIVYGFTPIFIYSHRLAYLENIITPLLLIALYLLNSYSIIPRTYQIVLLLIISGLGLWIKLPAIWIALVISFWLIKWKKLKPVLWTIGVTLVSLIFFIIYSLSINSDKFLKTMQIQGGRGTDINAFFMIMTKPDFYQPFHDGLYLIGFLSVLALILTEHRNDRLDFISINFFLWLTVIILTTNQTNNFFWYRMPLYPFMCMGMAYFIEQIFAKNRLLIAIPFIILGFFGLDALSLQVPNIIVRIFFLICMVAVMIPTIRPHSKFGLIISKVATAGLLILILGLNLITVVKYPSTQCLADNCLLPDKIILNR